MNDTLTWEEQEYIREEEFAGLFITMDVVSMALIIASNGFVLILVGYHKHLRTSGNMYIVSLCIADLTVAIFPIPLEIISHFSNKLTTEICKVVEFCNYVGLTANLYCVVAIAIDRYRAVVYPLQRKLSFKEALRSIALVWICSLAYGTRAAVVYDVTDTVHYINDEWMAFYSCGVPEHQADVQRYLYLLDFVFMYAGPVGIIIILYIRVGIALHTDRLRIQPAPAIQKRKKRILKMLLMVVLVFAICELPIQVWHLYVHWGPGPFPYYLIILQIVDIVSFATGWLNVIAYMLFHEKFSKIIFVCRPLQRVVPQSSELPTVNSTIPGERRPTASRP